MTLPTKPAIVTSMPPRAPGSITRRMEQLHDEVRLGAHLAWMDARDRWQGIKPRLIQAEQMAEHLTEITFHAMGEMAAEVKRFQDQRTLRRPRG